MRLPVIRPITYPEVYISGNVTIEEGAIIAPGVILKATPESSIVIKTGACLGMGSILTASSGTIQIEAGVIIGAGVLMIGSGRIGANACIGSASTILNSSIEQSTVVLAGSLIGDPSQENIVTMEIEANIAEEKVSDPWSNETSTVEKTPNQPVVTPTSSPKDNSKNPVVGQVYINQLLVTLFPERESIKNTDHY